MTSLAVFRSNRFLVVALLACLLAGCGDSGSGPAGERLLSVIAQWEPSSLDPAISGYVYTRMQIAETLVNADDEGQPLPGLASDWRESGDRLSWHFTLLPGVRFHDGSVLDGAHAAWVLNRARARAGALSGAPIAAITGSGNELIIQLTRPYSLLPALLAHSSTQMLAPASFAPDGSVKAVIGTGPYALVRITPPQSLEVRLSEYWRGPVPAVTAARYLAIGRAESRALIAGSGQADLVFDLDALATERLARETPERLVSATTPRTVILLLDAGHPALSDPRARLALSLAVDRDRIAAAILRDATLAASQLMPPTIADWHDATLPALHRDPAAARALLAELGWQPAADGILVRDGQRFALELRVPSNRPELPVVAAALQEQLRAIGVRIDIVVGNDGDIPLLHHEGTLELALGARNYATLNDPGATLAQDFSHGGGDWGAMNWAETQVAQALQALAAGVDPAQGALLRRRIVGELQRGLPVIPIAWYRQSLAVSERVSGASLDPMQRSYRLDALRWKTREPAR